VKTAERQRRATGASLAAIVLAIVAFCAAMLLHLLRRDVDPLQQMMSEYANGSRGAVMTVVFYAFGLAVLALGARLRTAIRRPGAGRLVPALLGVAGGSLVLSGVFEVGRPGVPDTVEEVVHSTASVAAFVLLILAMLLFSYATWRDANWWTFRGVSAGLAGAAALAGVLTPLLDGSAWSGGLQRLLAGTALVWVLLTAVRVRANAIRRVH
jgi:hypothetical protein